MPPETRKGEDEKKEEKISKYYSGRAIKIFKNQLQNARDFTNMD